MVARVTAKLTEFQLSTLRWIADGCPGEATNGRKLSARSLSAKHLARVKGRGPTWVAEVTERGSTLLDHGMLPEELEAEQKRLLAVERKRQAEDDRLDAEAEYALQMEARLREARKPLDLTVDSPAGVRRRRRRPAGDALFSRQRPDVQDEKILISVKEAAWMLALTENAIRAAVRDGDLDRVFIGQGATHYRIVYGSLLAWVNSMPLESATELWHSP